MLHNTYYFGKPSLIPKLLLPCAYDTSRMQASGERSVYCAQFIEPVTFARCAFIFALQNIALG